MVIGDVIGTGVFLKARVMTCNVGTPGLVVAVWVVGGLLSLAGALTYAAAALGLIIPALVFGLGRVAAHLWRAGE